MIWMGIDVGSHRIGVAISDPGGIIAQPLTTLDAPKSGGMPTSDIAQLVADRGVEGIVVGMPRNMDGTMGPAAEFAEASALQIQEAVGIEVEFWDERLTSVEADRLLVEAGVRREKRKGATDRIAAALILQGFLDRRALSAAAVDVEVES